MVKYPKGMIRMLFKNIILDGKITDILVKNGMIEKIAPNLSDDEVIDCTGLTALPSFIDLHVHLREPGFEHKETVFTGTLAARNGGFSDVFCMPNTKPVCDSVEVVKMILEKEKNVRVHPVCAITKGQQGKELCDFGAYKEAGIIAVSDDGMPVPDDDILEKAMIAAKENGLLVISHCENKSVITDKLNIPSEAEYSDVIRVIGLAEKTGAKVHLAHISTKESVAAIREAKKAGIDVSAETCPHYFTITADAFNIHGPNAMMNPPLRFEADKEAILEALTDGTFDVLSTDHAPHSIEEKSVDPYKAPFGIIGLETSFPLSYSALVKTGIMSLSDLSKLMSDAPAKRAGIAVPTIKEGASADFVAADLENTFVFDKEKCLSKSRNTPFSGREMTGRAVYSIVKGDVFKCQPIF